ncbi:MAG: glycosyltransferase family 2 protein [Elusimicrobiota bacterium]|nr:MAG: glycosyltransferase family 2 protein [Elusimicrobiota bacterium]
MTPELTILTLTLNEEGALGEFLSSLDAAIRPFEPNYEVLIVDGGSTDKTLEIAAKSGARVVKQSAPGYGNAYREGLALAKGKYILALDADSSHPKYLFGKFWSERENYSVVMGSRYLPGAGDTRPWGRRLLSQVLNAVYRTVLVCPLTDISGGFRLYKTKDVQAIKSEGPYYDVVAEIIVRLWGDGKKVLELPYLYVPREQGESKARIFKFGMSYLKTLYSLWRTYK